MHGGEHFGQQAVAGHRVEDAGLAIHQHQDHRGQADDGAHLDGLGEPAPLRAQRIHGNRNRIGHVEQFVVDHQRHHDGDEDVEHGADQQRADDADGHVAFGVFRFLARGRDRFEADVGEEHDRRGAQDAAPAELAFFAGRFGNEGVPVGFQRVEMLDDVPADDHDERDDHRHLDRDDDVVDLGAFGHAHHQQAGQRDADQKRGQVEQRGHRGAVGGKHRHAVAHQGIAVGAGEFGRNHQSVIAEQADHVARPADCDHRGRQPVFKQQQPAHDPGGELADRGVAVGVSGAGDGQGGRQFGVAQAGQRADDTGHQKGQQHRGAGVQRRSVAGTHEDACADDATDTKEYEIPGAERALELAGLGFPLDLFDALADQHPRKQTLFRSGRHQSVPVSGAARVVVGAQVHV